MILKSSPFLYILCIGELSEENFHVGPGKQYLGFTMLFKTLSFGAAEQFQLLGKVIFISSFDIDLRFN